MSRPLIVAVEPLMPDQLRGLEAEAVSLGIRNVTTLRDRWADGSERYDHPGEHALAAVDPTTDQPVGIGALHWCPHDPSALRMRRFYVSLDSRRHGVARALAHHLIACDKDHTDALTCNAGASSGAAPFWESMGFERVRETGITHRRAVGPSTVW